MIHGNLSGSPDLSDSDKNRIGILGVELVRRNLVQNFPFWGYHNELLILHT